MTILCVCCQSCLFPPTIDAILQLMIPFHHEWRKHCFTCVYHYIIRDNYMWEVGERAGGGAVPPYLFYTLWWDATMATHPFCYEDVCSLIPKSFVPTFVPTFRQRRKKSCSARLYSLHRRHHYVMISHWRDDFYCSLSACPMAL